MGSCSHTLRSIVMTDQQPDQQHQRGSFVDLLHGAHTEDVQDLEDGELPELPDIPDELMHAVHVAVQPRGSPGRPCRQPPRQPTRRDSDERLLRSLVPVLESTLATLQIRALERESVAEAAEAFRRALRTNHILREAVAKPICSDRRPMLAAYSRRPICSGRRPMIIAAT
jgi:hypothetical protein